MNSFVEPDFKKKATSIPINTSIKTTQIKSPFPKAFVNNPESPQRPFPCINIPANAAISNENKASLVTNANTTATSAGTTDQIPK